MADEKNRKGKATRDFRDAGDEKLFENGKTYEFGEGAFGNYHAAGLIEADDASAAPAKPLPSPMPPRDAAA